MSSPVKLSELEKLVKSFVKLKNYDHSKETITNFFIKKDENGEFTKNSFIEILRTACGKKEKEVSQEEYADAVRQKVKSYTSSKETAVKLTKLLTAYIEKRTGYTYVVNYPPIPTENTFERLMFISKYFQNPDAKVSDLEDILWISDRTISDDIKKLRGLDNDPIQICGKKYVIEDLYRVNDHIRDMASTPHPFFLTCNITQIIIMLKGLKEMAENRAFYGYAMKTVSEIWEQLSDMAKNRILYVMENLMPGEIEWYENLGNMGKKSFWPEYECSSFSHNAVLECLKNKKLCYIEYETDNGTELLNGVVIERYYNKTVKIMDKGIERGLDMDRIIRSSTMPELLF